jgi:hypothetical protein
MLGSGGGQGVFPLSCVMPGSARPRSGHPARGRGALQRCEVARDVRSLILDALLKSIDRINGSGPP